MGSIQVMTTESTESGDGRRC